MPEISRFYGIVIRMYGLDHAPPWREQRTEAERLDAELKANLEALRFSG